MNGRQIATRSELYREILESLDRSALLLAKVPRVAIHKRDLEGLKASLAYTRAAHLEFEEIVRRRFP